jgi:hypothetical protein
MTYGYRPRPEFHHVPPGFSREARRLDEIAAACERQRQEQAQIARMEADLIAPAKQGQLVAPPDEGPDPLGR